MVGGVGPRLPCGSCTGPLGAVAYGPHSGYIDDVQADFVQLTITIPASLADDNAAERARVLLVLDAVRGKKMTWRAAASALRIAPDELLDLARTHGVPILHYEISDLDEDLSTLARLERGRATGA